MDVDDGLTPIQFLENGPELGVAQPRIAVAGGNPEAVEWEALRLRLPAIQPSGESSDARLRSDADPSPRDSQESEPQGVDLHFVIEYRFYM